MDFLRVTYRVEATGGEARRRAEALALEQTVEVPRPVVRDEFVETRILGRVESVAEDARGGSRITVAIPEDATALDPAQILNLMFGNSSLHADVECVDVEVSPAIAAALGGPRFGLAGIRDLAGVHHRPLACTALKPMGQTPQALAALFRDFGLAGIDFVKDDHGLADHPFCPFEDRVRACLEVEGEVAALTGRRPVYVPNLIGSPETILRQLDFAQESGARAVMLAPMLVGLPFFWEVCRRRASVPVLAHPSFGGAQRIAADLLFGRLLRAFGADAVIFVSFGSRFSPPPEECRRLADRLTEPRHGWLPAMPVPGGGIDVGNAAEVAAFYGADSMLLVGGNLQLDEAGVGARSRAFVAALGGS